MGRPRSAVKLALASVAVVALGVSVARLTAPPATGESGSTPTRGARTASTPPPVSASATPVAPAQRAGSLPAEDPINARLPSGALVPVVAVSSRANGFLDVPEDIDTAGWWRGGSRIGDPFGSTLVAAHVDSRTQGLGPFAELLSVRPGARIELAGRSLHQTFRVRSLRLVRQGSLDDDRWIYAVGGQRRLTLVTCAGPYDAANGGYQNLAVVVAVPVGLPTPRRP